MKKIKILLFFSIFLIFLFISSMFFNINGIILKQYWFSIACVLIGQYSFVYFCMYKLDSSLYYFVLTTYLGVCSFFQSAFSLKFSYYYPLYLLCFALPSFAVFALFRQKIHFKLFAFFFIECILLIVYKLNFLNIWHLFVLNGAYLLLIMLEAIFRIKYNLKEN